MRENFVQFSSKQENQTRIITFVNNLYKIYQVSLNYFFLGHIIFETEQIVSTNDTIHLLHHVNKRSKVINSVNDYKTKNILTIYFFSTSHLETHAICSIIIKTNSNKRMASNNKWKFLTTPKIVYASTVASIRWPNVWTFCEKNCSEHVHLKNIYNIFL